MLKGFFKPSRAVWLMGLAALPLAAPAQNRTQDSLLRRGEVVGTRPSAATGRTGPSASRPADPVLARLLKESVDVPRLPAAQMPDLYARFLEAVRAERRGWNPRQWDEASAALTRLNARYEQVRQELPLNERLQIRSLQGEFRTLEGARRVKDRLE